MALRKALWAEGIRGYRVNVAKLPGKPDLVFGRTKLCIFCQGCFWHRCPKCSLRRNLKPTANSGYWDRKFEQNVLRDTRNRQLLESLGWRVLEVWECEIKENLPLIVSEIAQELAKTLRLE